MTHRHAPYPNQACILDVGPRDGLQNEKSWIATAVKIELVQRLQSAGVKAIEVTSYVSPKWVPQMADAHDVMVGITRHPGVSYAVLTPNLKGYEAAIADLPDEIVVFGSASETFSHRNINCSIEESLERFRPVVAAARAAGVRVRGTMSCAVGCPYEGEVAPREVGRLAGLLKGLGVQQVVVCDTIGVGTPDAVRLALQATLQHYERDEVSCHFHDTHGRALDNVRAALALGIWHFESSVGGLGGCPYAPGAPGNVATEAVVELLHGLGIPTGIDLEALRETGLFIRHALLAAAN